MEIVNTGFYSLDPAADFQEYTRQEAKERESDRSETRRSKRMRQLVCAGQFLTASSNIMYRHLLQSILVRATRK